MARLAWVGKLQIAMRIKSKSSGILGVRKHNRMVLEVESYVETKDMLKVKVSARAMGNLCEKQGELVKGDAVPCLVESNS